MIAQAVTVVGCGGSADREADTSDETADDTADDSGDSSDDDTADDDEEDDDDSITPSYDYDFELAGPDDEFTADVETDSILNVRVTAGDGVVEVVNSGTGQQISQTFLTYTCVQYTVTVNGISQETAPLAVSGAGRYSSGYSDPCATSESSDVLDFSTALGSEGTVEVTVSEAQYDYKCLYVYTSYCGTLTDLYQYSGTSSEHKINGGLEIEVNGSGSVD